MDAADYVIWTEGALDLHASQLDRILVDINRIALSTASPR
jgi:hypothetical protein